VRDELFSNEPDQYEALDSLADDGIGVTTIIGSPAEGIPTLEERIAILKTDLAGSVEAVEGPNEYSTQGSPDWKEELLVYQQRLYEEVKGDPALSSLPVIGPSIVHNDQAELGDISQYLDYGNIHSYPEGNGPEYRMGLNVERAELNSETKPIMATETGYTTAVAWNPAGPGENRPVPGDVMATYMPRLFFEYFSRHIARTYSYELLDQRPDPEHDDRESNFGLLRNDLSKKPAFDALANTIRLLEDPGPAFTPGSLDYTLSGETANLHRVLLEKRDGTFYLALWRITSVWDPIAKTALDPPSEPVTLEVQPGIETASEYLPNVSTAPVRTLTEPSQVSVGVGPAIVLIKLTPASMGEGGEAGVPPLRTGDPPPSARSANPPVAQPNSPVRPHLTVSVLRRDAAGLVLGGRVLPTPDRPRQITVQNWSGDRWQAIDRGLSSADGSFRLRLELPLDVGAPVTRIRLASGNARPSRTIRVHASG
jgi:hypothetical protein